ncbi:MAG: hypothetical protein M1827_004528 [Pycnora praestabilis]|nr:MAG: hypothetical protein M1827_004528 [Pycnora praestabilis]
MPPSKRSKPSSSSSPSPSSRPTESETPAETPKPTDNVRPSQVWVLAKIVVAITKAAVLLALAALQCQLSQRTLSPVYGSIPSSLYHEKAMLAVGVISWLGRPYLQQYLPSHSSQFLALFALTIPTIQFFLFRQSSILGPTIGPLLTEALTCLPLLLLSIFNAAESLASLDLSRFGQLLADTLPLITSYALFNVADNTATSLVHKYIASTRLLTSSGLQYLSGLIYARISPSKLQLLAFLPLLHSGLYNVHLPLPQTTSVLETTLLDHGYALLDRQESLTGYISVLENTRDQFRVLRCDHSLLGGEWRRDHTAKIRQPIYSVFIMLEAVRLVDGGLSKRHSAFLAAQEKALVVGLGIGTTPAALIAHGINTTSVEIDPVVHQFASQYFSLPDNHTAVIEDAVTFVQRAQIAEEERLTYDYIVHDVFTGGAEPEELFTVEFLGGLSELLKAGGVIAINYGGDILLPSARLSIRTIKTVFPSCRIFRETPASTSPREPPSDFTNMVIFCTKSPTPFHFRDVTEADLLGRGDFAREFLPPRYEIDEEMFKADAREGEGQGEVLRKGKTGGLREGQKRSAVDHWGIMRGVLPGVVWENY